MRRTISLFLCLALLTVAAAGGFASFTGRGAYTPGQFADVDESAWYAQSVAAACGFGLMKGLTADRFDPDGPITVAQAATMAARLHSIYHTGGESFVQGTPWYRVYVDYALANGILAGEYADYNRAATRAEFALILSAALPAEALAAINIIEPGAIPDVAVDSLYAGPVYTLYRAGVLTGSDEAGTFGPNADISRSAAAAILTRMADPSLRRGLTLTAGARPDAAALYKENAPATFLLEAYDYTGQPLGRGSGFFIDSAGIAVTNYHVIQGSFYALAETPDNRVHRVLGVLAYDMDQDIAILQVEGSGFPVLSAGDSSLVKTGETVYTIGSPRGIRDSMSEGIVSYADRQGMIQFTAPISPGSSGGALFNDRGQVIGITTMARTDGNDLYFAVPINAALDLERDEAESLAQVAAAEAVRQYERRPAFGEVTIPESGSHTTWDEPMDLPLGYTLMGSLTDAEMDAFRASCLCPGRLVIYAVTDAAGADFDDLVLVALDESAKSGLVTGSQTTMMGSNALKLEVEVTEPGPVYYALLSRELALTGPIYMEYALYCVFIPE